MASMDVCCNFSFLLSAVLLCTNSSSLLFSIPPNGLSLDAASFLVFLVHLHLTMFCVYCFFTLLYLFNSCLLYFSFHMTYPSYWISMKEKIIDDFFFFLQITHLIICVANFIRFFFNCFYVFIDYWIFWFVKYQYENCCMSWDIYFTFILPDKINKELI